MIRYPLGIQTFSEIYKGNYIYVDKTQYVHQLASVGKFYFLSRPRRFGKSLFLSTLKSYFLGEKEYFKGLALEKLEKDWTVYPVLDISLNCENFSKNEIVISSLNLILSEWEDIYGRSPREQTLSDRFRGVIQRAYRQTGKQVVVLIDEYDKPLLDTITDKHENEEIRKILKGFYSILKNQEQYIRFAFLTGVTKFSHVSIFSDLNQLKDISFTEQFAGICGISEDELHKYFDESIKNLAEHNDITKEQCCEKLKKRYDGYHFYLPSTGMYNPVSLLNAFIDNNFSDYWFASGTPSFLAELLRKGDYCLELLEETSITTDMIGNIDTFDENPLPILYQSGYLTLKDYDKDCESYILTYPNQEVAKGFINFLIPYFSNTRNLRGRSYLVTFVKSVRAGKPEEFLNIMKLLFDDQDYRIAGDKENYFQNCMYLIFKLMGFFVEVERCTSQGRVDVVLGTDDYLYVMELKVGVSAQEAIQQIDSKGYMLPFQQDHRKLVKIGVSFDLDKRTLTEWLIEGL